MAAADQEEAEEKKDEKAAASAAGNGDPGAPLAGEAPEACPAGPAALPGALPDREVAGGARAAELCPNCGGRRDEDPPREGAASPGAPRGAEVVSAPTSPRGSSGGGGGDRGHPAPSDAFAAEVRPQEPAALPGALPGVEGNRARRHSGSGTSSGGHAPQPDGEVAEAQPQEAAALPGTVFESEEAGARRGRFGKKNGKMRRTISFADEGSLASEAEKPPAPLGDSPPPPPGSPPPELPAIRYSGGSSSLGAAMRRSQEAAAADRAVGPDAVTAKVSADSGDSPSQSSSCSTAPSPKQPRQLRKMATVPCMPSLRDDGEEPDSDEGASTPVKMIRALSMPLPRERRELSHSLYESVMRLDLYKVQELIAAGTLVNVPIKGPPGMPSYVTLLHALAGLSAHDDGRAPRGSLQIIEVLIRAKANLNPRSSDGSTPLILACAKKNIGAAELLLSWGADISPVDDYGYDCLMWAASLPLPRKSSKPPPPPPRPPSHLGYPHADGGSSSEPTLPAAKPPGEGLVSAELVRMLVNEKAKDEAARAVMSKPKHSPSDGDICGTLGHANYIKPVDKSVPRGSPLLVAVRHANHEAAAVLLESGMQPVGLHDAARTGSVELVKVLLSGRADPLERDENGETPMDIALQTNEDSMIMDALREAARYSCVGQWDGDDIQEVGHIKRKRTQSKERERSETVARLKSAVMSRTQVEVESCQEGRSERLLRCLPAGARRCCASTAATMKSWAEEVSRSCRQLCRHQVFQGIMFATLLGALFIPDMWVILDAKSDTLLDIILIMLLFAFVVELIVQAVGLGLCYLKSFFFHTDLIGACSLLLDLSAFRNLGSGSTFGDNAVIMRAARAARLGARAGRFTKLMKLLRFLHGSPQSSTDAGTAKGLTSVLVTRLSILVSCLIITLMIVLPIFELMKYPEQDWAMQMWVAQLADAMEEGATSAEVNELLRDFRADFQDRNYQPHILKWRNESTEVLLWQTTTKLRPANEFQVVVGKVTATFNWASVNRTEAITNLAMMVFTILLLVGFTSMISKSVSKIALMPLEMILSKVRLMGSTIYRNVESMHKQLGFQPSTRGPAEGSVGQDGWEDYACETALLDCVVRKLAALSEITMRKTRPNDDQTLQYLGEVLALNEDTAHLHTTPGGKSEDGLARRNSSAYSSEENFDQFTEVFVEEHYSWKVCSWDFNPLGLKLADTTAICSAIFGYAIGKANGPDEEKLSHFLSEASAGYLKGPQYHNWDHAVDVTHTLFMLFHRCSKHCTFMSWLEEYALLVSAVCHDIGHIGVTNDFLVQTSNELAIRYNDTSPLENMHCARLFEIVTEQNSAIFAMLSKAQYKEVRSICIEAILHTDNKHHVDCLRRLQMFGEMNSELLQVAQDIHHRSADSPGDPEEIGRTFSTGPFAQSSSFDHWPPRELLDALWAPEWRTVIRNTLLHFADISNPVRPFEVCKDWAVVILEEFFAQGDVAKQLGLPVVALHDREKTNLAFSQIGFIDFFAAPLVFAMVRMLAPLADLAEQLIANTNQWAQLWLSEAHPSDEEVINLTQRIKRLEDRAAHLLPSRRTTGQMGASLCVARRTSNQGDLRRSKVSSVSSA